MDTSRMLDTITTPFSQRSRSFSDFHALAALTAQRLRSTTYGSSKDWQITSMESSAVERRTEAILLRQAAIGSHLLRRFQSMIRTAMSITCLFRATANDKHLIGLDFSSFPLLT